PGPGGTSARVVRGVTANIIIDLKKGNDALGVGNSVDDLLALADDCGFGLGLGSGSVSMSSSGVAPVHQEQPVLEGTFTAPASLIVNLGDGNNSTAIIAVLKGSLVVNGGRNADNVAFGNVRDTTGDAVVNGDVVIATGAGADN